MLKAPTILVLAAVLSIISTVAKAENATPEEVVLPVVPEQAGGVPSQIFGFASRFTVKVVNQLVNPFTAAAQSGHGSGFIVGSRLNSKGEPIGIIFTNKHVVGRPWSIFARQTSLEFATDTDIPDRVSAEVVYESELNDFAVLEFKINDLKRVKGQIMAARLPSERSPYYDFVKNFRDLQGEQVLAHGSPLSSNSVTTFGNITGRWSNMSQGDFIQTQTPINPGNSGGPLISRATGEVIGINSMKMAGADNTGYALPVGVVLDEYKRWRQNPSVVARNRILGASMAMLSPAEMRMLGIKSLIEQEIPDYFNRYSSILRIQDAAPYTNLKVGDIVLKVNGAPMRPTLYALRKTIQGTAGDTLDITVIRNGVPVQVKAAITDLTNRDRRNSVDFVIINGMLFRNYAYDYWTKKAVGSEVGFEVQLYSPEANFRSDRQAIQGSALVGVQIDNQEYPVTNLTDLKQAIRQHPNAKFINLVVREPVVTNEGNSVITRQGTFSYQPATSVYIVPLTKVVTPRTFSLNRFRQQFSFDGDAPETHDWRNFVRQPPKQLPNLTCDDPIDPQTP